MSAQRLGVAPDPNPFLASEGHRPVRRRLDLENHATLTVQRDLANPKVDLRLELSTEKVLELLPANLLGARLKCGSYDLMRFIAHPPDEECTVLVVEACRVGEGRYLLPDLPRIVIVDLELDPFGFSRQGDQTREQVAIIVIHRAFPTVPKSQAIQIYPRPSTAPESRVPQEDPSRSPRAGSRP